ncbi:MAG: tRNA (adenosine(37)-N6)-dimethylallyltransferase MiaA [Candidatus Omnitrophota bacterium]
MKPRIVFLVGPTAAGKTDVAVALAKKIKAEIISCDSMQVYRGMDILTSRPPLTFSKSIPHYLLNIISPEKEYNVSRYRKDATLKIKEIIKRRKVPLIVGGSGLYMSILIDGIFKGNPVAKAMRNRLYQEAKVKGSKYLYERLKDFDPDAAIKIHPHDTKRIIRALEVFEATGKPISYLQRQRRGLADEYKIKIFCLNMQRDKLYRRIEERVERMFARGAVPEVKKLLKLKLSKTARYALGIREIKGYLEGVYDLKEAKCLMKRNTRLYAKRQLTWFRKDKRIQWVEVKGGEKTASIANRIIKNLAT